MLSCEKFSQEWEEKFAVYSAGEGGVFSQTVEVGGDTSGVTLHADSLEEVTGEGGHLGYGGGEGTEGDDFVVYGVEEGEGVFWGCGFYGFAESVDVVLW
jgi:hypothetical protein